MRSNFTAYLPSPIIGISLRPLNVFTVIINKASAMKIKNLLITLTFITISLRAEAFEKRDFRNSVSLQLGINGTVQDSKYDLVFIPPDLSYSREIFDNDNVNISTATYYDNIGVEIEGSNFSYRVGQRIDIGYEIENYVPYITAGIGIIKNAHHFQTAPVYGVGIMYQLSPRVWLVNEINFQNVRYQNRHYDIANLAIGVTYMF